MASLRQRMLEDMQVRRLSACTQRTYAETVARFARYFDRSPARLGPEQIRAYQVYLTNERRLAPSSLVVAVSALRFLYRVTLQKRWVFDDIRGTRLSALSAAALVCQGLSPRIRRATARDIGAFICPTPDERSDEFRRRGQERRNRWRPAKGSTERELLGECGGGRLYHRGYDRGASGIFVVLSRKLDASGRRSNGGPTPQATTSGS